VVAAGKYEDDFDNNATFDEGDWNRDGDFDSNDLVFALQTGIYVAAVIERLQGQPAAAFDTLFADDDSIHDRRDRTLPGRMQASLHRESMRSGFYDDLLAPDCWPC
jgi:hypothetical protein